MAKQTKNLIAAKDQYNAYYGAFRGVDFASDHTEVDSSRFPYAVNVYRDYLSGQGTAVETIPGFRCRASFEDNGAKIHGIYSYDPDLGGESYTPTILLHRGNKLHLLKQDGDKFKAVTTKDKKPIVFEMTDGESSSFKSGKYIYVICAEHFWQIDMETNGATDIYASASAYIPTIAVNGELYAQANMLADKVTERFNTENDEPGAEYLFTRANGLTLDGIVAVDDKGGTIPIVSQDSNDEGYSAPELFVITDDSDSGVIGVKWTSNSDPSLMPLTFTVTYPYQAGIKQSDGTVVNPIKGCTKSCAFDNRVFLSGNPAFPNYVFWSGFDEGGTGAPDATYFGELNFETLGQSNEPISAMLPIANVLGVFKRYAEQDGAVYYLTPVLTEQNLFAKAYQMERGLNGVQCLGAAINFRDDPIFISPQGVEGIGTLSVRYERSIEHRSSLIDPVLVKCNLNNAKLAVWNGWLWVLCDNGKVFLADSRQAYTHKQTGDLQYEWYYLEDIGEYVEQIQNGEIDADDYDSNYACGENYGGTFSPACSIAVINGNVFFGTENGNLFSFNFDKRKSDGEMPADAYSFDGRRYISGVATKMDSVGAPHLNKTTVKKSVVVKFRSMTHSAAKVRVRTNKTPYTEIVRVSSAIFDFADFNFGDVVFSPTNTPISVIPEKEKKWVEKQYYIFSDEFEKPFSLVYLAYRYVIAGRYKE